MKTTEAVLWLSLPVGGWHYSVEAYVPTEIRQKWEETSYTMSDALKTIETRAPQRNEADVELYYAARYIDRNSHLFYAKQEERDALWDMANGSWELLMGYEQPKVDDFFLPYPPFRDYAMAFVIVDTNDNYFGKGIASSPDFSYCALGGPSKVNERTRQLYMDYNDFYINGQQVFGWDLSYFMRGYARNWYAIERNRPPLAFTLIAVTENIMIVRGSKTGGMAIFRRIDGDMREAAYGQPPWREKIAGFWSKTLGKSKGEETSSA